jgi:hypothetical protein
MMRGKLRGGSGKQQQHNNVLNNPKESKAAQQALRDGQTVIYAVRDGVSNGGGGATSTGVGSSSGAGAMSHGSSNGSGSPENNHSGSSSSKLLSGDEAALTAKNYRLAKELVRVYVLMLLLLFGMCAYSRIVYI